MRMDYILNKTRFYMLSIYLDKLENEIMESEKETSLEALRMNLLSHLDISKSHLIKFLPSQDDLRTQILQIYKDYQNLEIKIIALREEEKKK